MLTFILSTSLPSSHSYVFPRMAWHWKWTPACLLTSVGLQHLEKLIFLKPTLYSIGLTILRKVVVIQHDFLWTGKNNPKLIKIWTSVVLVINMFFIFAYCISSNSIIQMVDFGICCIIKPRKLCSEDCIASCCQKGTNWLISQKTGTYFFWFDTKTRKTFG